MAAKLRTLKAKAGPAEALKKLIELSLDNGKAQDISCISLQGKSDLADYMIVATGTSTRHVGALAEQLVQKISESKITTFSTEGMSQCSWVIVDTPYVMVHIFLPEMRSMYNLEKMWAADFDTSGGSAFTL